MASAGSASGVAEWITAGVGSLGWGGLTVGRVARCAGNRWVGGGGGCQFWPRRVVAAVGGGDGGDVDAGAVVAGEQVLDRRGAARGSRAGLAVAGGRRGFEGGRCRAGEQVVDQGGE